MVKSVKAVFKPSWKILAQLNNEGLSELETDMRTSRAGDNYKKKVKSVSPVFKPAREILVELPNEEVGEPKLTRESFVRAKPTKRMSNG
jgi:hypothetical protein